jgi:hypothetical protein
VINDSRRIYILKLLNKKNIALTALGLQVIGLLGYVQFGPSFIPAQLTSYSEGCTPTSSELPKICTGVQPQTMCVGTTAELDGIFHAHDYVLDNVKDGSGNVPRLYLAKLPKDMKKHSGPPKKQQHLFVKSLLPMILQVNEDVREKRETLLEIKHRMAKGESITPEQKVWLHELATE